MLSFWIKTYYRPHHICLPFYSFQNYKYRVLDKEDEHLKVFESDESDSEVPPAPKAAEER